MSYLCVCVGWWGMYRYLEINVLVLNLSARTCLQLGCSQGHGGRATELWSGGHVRRAYPSWRRHACSVKPTCISALHALRHFLSMLRQGASQPLAPRAAGLPALCLSHRRTLSTAPSHAKTVAKLPQVNVSTISDS